MRPRTRRSTRNRAFPRTKRGQVPTRRGGLQRRDPLSVRRLAQRVDQRTAASQHYARFAHRLHLHVENLHDHARVWRRIRCPGRGGRGSRLARAVRRPPSPGASQCLRSPAPPSPCRGLADGDGPGAPGRSWLMDPVGPEGAAADSAPGGSLIRLPLLELPQVDHGRRPAARLLFQDDVHDGANRRLDLDAGLQDHRCPLLDHADRVGARRDRLKAEIAVVVRGAHGESRGVPFLDEDDGRPDRRLLSREHDLAAQASAFGGGGWRDPGRGLHRRSRAEWQKRRPCRSGRVWAAARRKPFHPRRPPTGRRPRRRTPRTGPAATDAQPLIDPIIEGAVPAASDPHPLPRDLSRARSQRTAPLAADLSLRRALPSSPLLVPRNLARG